VRCWSVVDMTDLPVKRFWVGEDWQRPRVR
jgi:hypothetical protein